ncbi:hypothetical protein DSM104299_03218 [Baekduia alba]|uniref:hypothetical protein n=1 Tax=Baekduia alba TaxID=2997333 RepID=UPI0023413AE8|nr:hypothetical protein [Baekduia alba]WCB94481.1 hypothetical protein DSM104299_03218 [Baekduia alba]
MSPLTPDERARAAEMLRFPERYDDREARVLADKLEAEPAGYDYESVAAERGEALEAVIAASDDLVRHGAFPAALAPAVGRACEVMAGVEPSLLRAERDEAREALRLAVETVDESARQGMPKLLPFHVRAIAAGVERTHALVPATQLQRLAGHICARRTLLRRRDAQEQVLQELQELEQALLAAARGERVDWPGVA